MKVGWHKHRIADVAEKITDGSHNPPKGVPHSEFMMLSSKNIFDDDLHYADPRYLTAAHFEQENKRTGILSGDVLLTIVGTIGRCAVVPNDAPKITLQRSVAVIRPKHSLVDSRFLMYSFVERSEELNDQARGVAQKGIYLETLRQLDVPLPPLPEQQRIVAILDEAFDGIATAKANAEKNLQNARALFESHLQSVFTERGEGWVDRTLDKVCVVERGSSPRPIKNFFTTAADGVNWIKIGDTEEGGKYVFTTGQKITPEGAKQSRYVKEGDFILTNSMSLGRPYIMKTDGYIHDGWFVLRLGDGIDSEFFYYLLSSSYVQGQFHTLAAGAVVKNISGDLVKRAVLPIPPLAQQHDLAERFVEFSEETQRLETIYQQKLTALDDLKKTLLHQAFSGAL